MPDSKKAAKKKKKSNKNNAVSKAIKLKKTKVSASTSQEKKLQPGKKGLEKSTIL